MIGASRVSSISKGTRRKKLEQGREWMVCEGFQFILKHQAEALLAMGVCPQFKDDVLCQFWRMYLQKSRQAYTKNPVHDGKFRLRSQGSGESDSAPESSVMSDSMTSASETDGDGDWASGGGSVSDYTSDGASSVCSGSIDAVSYLTPRQRRSQGLMSMPKTLALCHLALLWAREAITLADLLRFVNEGHIPYVNAYEDFPEEMKLYGRDSLIFRVESIPSYSHLHKEAQTLAVFLELPLFPPITLDCLLHPSLLSLRYLTEANLPDELHDWVCRIMEKAGMESSVTFEPMRSNSLLPHYDVQAAALIIIAMKLLFKLDDHTEWDLSNDASDKNKENPDVNSFNLRRWYRTMQTALTTAVRRQQDNIARKHWKAQKPLYTSKKDKSVVLKRRRIAEQLQLSFQKLSGSPVPPPSSPPSSFCFRWSEEGEEVWDGPSLHHQTLDSSVRQRGASLQPSNPKYWHPALKACKPRFCKSHYAEVEVTLPRMYVWLLNLFSFLMGVKPGCVYEEVLKVERHFLGSSKSQPRARATPRKTQPKKLPKRKQTRKTCSRKRGVLVLQNEPSYSGGQRQAFTEDDEAWRAFLENPLTAASKAMMSINGDEDSANALGLLYDYYKVPRDRRTTGQPKTEVLLGDADPNKINVMMPLQDSPLRAVPRNTAAKGSSQPSQGDKIRALYPASDSIVCLSRPPSYSISTGRTLALHSFPVGLPPGPHSSQSDGMAFSHQLNHSQYSPRAKSLTPDSTYTEPYKGSSSNCVFPHSEELQQRMASIPPGGYPYYSLTASQHFEYMLEAPQSIRPKSGSGQMSYLNKGQFYPITLRELGDPTVLPHLNGAFRSVVMLVFGEEKFTDDQLKHWRYWHSRQHTAKQRCIDIADYKESFNTIASIEEIAYNAISFTWDTKDEPRVFVSVNCLSTDFSPQKGVRGLPLNLQIDTYSCGGHGDKLVHRAYCQIKVFCDKGAERKIRDEERKQTQRKGRGQETTAACVEDPLKLKHVDITSFKAMSDMDSQPVLFIPEVYFPSTLRHHACLSDDGEDGLGQKRLLHYDEEFDSATHKRARREEPEKVLLYVRKETEEVFDALMLRTPTLAGLLEAVSDKYELPLGKMGKVYKRCKKGILVHMDDNIIKHYSNEDAFHIRMEEVGGKVLLTLTEI